MRVYFSKGIAASTQRTYKSGKNRYLDFCEKASVTPLPVREKHLCSFVAHLANEGLKFRTIKVYLSAIRHLQIEAGMSDPFKESMLRLEYVTKGIKKHEVEKGVRERPRLPITPLLLLKMKAAWEASAASFDTKMLWAASCLCFFAFLRAGEMTVPTETAYDPAVHLGVLDLAVDDAAQPTCLRLTIKQSKTDPFRKGVNLYVGRGQANLCPVSAVRGFLSVRGSTPGPLFVFEDGRGSHRRFGRPCQLLALTNLSTARTASGSGRRRQRLQKASRTPSFRLWAGGRVRRTCVMCESRGNS